MSDGREEIITRPRSESASKDTEDSTALRGPSARTSSPNSTEEIRPQRAAHACHRCRRMKLRCVGGLPCIRCRRAKQPCDGEHPDEIDGGTAASLKRIAELEETVRTLIQRTGAPSNDVAFAPPETIPQAAVHLAAMHNVRFDMASTQVEMDGTYNPVASAYPKQDLPMVSFDMGLASQGVSMERMNDGIPAMAPFQTISPQYSAHSLQRGTPPAPPLPRDSPASRLAVAQDSSIMQPPFRPLLIRSRVWDNKQPSRPGSPSNGEDAWYFEGKAGPSSDPISESIVTVEVGNHLFDL